MARGRKTGGRQKGSLNIATVDLRDAILGALQAVDGQAYLQRVAETDPRTFCALLGRLLPATIAGDANNPADVATAIRVTVVG